MKTFVEHDLPPETMAMIQALYSRSPKSVVEHLATIRDRGADAFMSQFYVGYGHKSIGDCGTTTLFVEDVSMLCAKAIQDSPLYNGQEASTRYMDMGRREFMNPLGTQIGTEIQERWRDLYNWLLPRLEAGIAHKHPRLEEESESVWGKAVKAKAFDIARGFLPAGATTFVSWHTTLSHAHEHLCEMDHHPLEEVVSVATGLRAALREKYPASFSHVVDPEIAEFMDRTYSAYADPSGWWPFDDFDADAKLFDYQKALDKRRLLENRPGRAYLSRETDTWGRIKFRFPLDFGSFRDLQRHRSCLIEMPVLGTTNFGSWYADALKTYLSPSDAGDALSVVYHQKSLIDALEASVDDRQYYTAMGFEVDTTIHASLRSAVYIARLRSSQAVHPTLRVIAQHIAKWIDNAFPGLDLAKADMGPDEWTSKRGTHDIIQKEETA